MAKAKKNDGDEQTIITILAKFFFNKPIIIDDVDKLVLEEQLKLVIPENICDQKARKKTTDNILEIVPDLKNCAHKRIRFKSLLSAYYRGYVEVRETNVQQFTAKQLPLSLFEYLVNEINSMNPSDDKAKAALQKEKKSMSASLKFVGYLIRFCGEKKFNGEDLHNFYMEVTKNGTKTGGFGLKFVQKICNEYSLKFGKFAKIKKKVGIWFTDNVERSKNLEKKKEQEQKQEPTLSKPAEEPKQEIVVMAKPVQITASWYWMDMEEYEWIPFSKNDLTILHQAYAERKKLCHVSDGKFRVEFDDEGAAAGNMFENNVADPPNKMVVRAEPEDGEIHGMTAATDAKPIS